MAVPTLLNSPWMPMASARLEGCTVSAINAVLPVGVKPVLMPCIKRKPKNMDTKCTQGYIKPQMSVAIAPIIITGLRPILSVSTPLKGLEINAIKEKTGITNPFRSGLPKSERCLLNSGTGRLKLQKNISEPRLMSQNCRGNGMRSAMFCNQWHPASAAKGLAAHT